MYPTSTQKKNWTLRSQEELDSLRTAANAKHIARFRPILAERPDVASEEDFLTAREESIICRIVTETGIKFGDDFKPDMWPSVRWMAFAYFKRFYLKESAMEYYPKNVMMASYYLAAKVDEFNVSIDNFVDNLRNGTRQYNVDTILALEPELMLKLNYNLTIHTPFRPFEGHLIEMKTLIAEQLGSFEFDLETIRPFSSEYFKRCLLGDVMFFYPPSQIALAAVKYGMDKTIGEFKSAELLRDFLACLLDVDLGGTADSILKLEKLQVRLDQICKLVREQAMQTVGQEVSTDLQKKFVAYIKKEQELMPRLKQLEKEQSGGGDVESDDEF